MYADDVQIYTHSTPENLVNSIQTINNNQTGVIVLVWRLTLYMLYVFIRCKL